MGAEPEQRTAKAGRAPGAARAAPGQRAGQAPGAAKAARGQRAEPAPEAARAAREQRAEQQAGCRPGSGRRQSERRGRRPRWQWQRLRVLRLVWCGLDSSRQYWGKLTGQGGRDGEELHYDGVVV